MTRAELLARWRKLAERIDALGLRERALIFVAVLAVLYAIAANLVFAPFGADKNRLERQLRAKHDEIQAIEAQTQALVSGGGAGGTPEKRERLATLETRLRVLDETLGKVTGGLVAPKEMARLVEQVLARSKRLEIVKLESLPPTPVAAAAPAAGAAPVAAGAVYKHGMRVELRGGYMDILAYLRELEGLPWKVFWGQATLESEKYPVSHLTLVIYTLSTREGWIGI
jgi:MSHA biogenesis protein MshJ